MACLKKQKEEEKAAAEAKKKAERDARCAEVSKALDNAYKLMNDYIKDICELCEFDEPITRVCFRGGEREEVLDMKWQVMGTHAARRTFICYALAEGIPPEVVMKFTGHSDYKAMKPYIDVSEDTKKEAMAVFNKGLNK